MTTYKEIFGKPVKLVSSDLSGDATTGEIWYNSTTGKFKSLLATGAWSSGGNLTTARQAVGGIGTLAANLVVGGYVAAESTLVEEYNGSGWSAGGALPVAKNSGGGFGTQTAGVYAGGGVSPNSTATNTSQEYNGTAWTASPGNLNTTRDQTAGAGTETAGLCCGGTPNGSAQENTSEEYNGSTWTAGNNLSTAVRSVNNNSLGIQTAALLVGGNSGSATTTVQSYDGTNWAATTVLPEARITLATSGTQTDGLAFGGNDGSNIENTNLKFDGSSWTALSTMGTARDGLGGSPSGTSSAAIASGGRQPGPANSSLTEEYNFSTNVITASAWATGGTMPVAKRVGGCSKGGSINSSLTFGGDTLPMGAGQPQVNTTEEYDGSSWTGGGVLGNNLSGGAGAGTSTAMIGATGYSFPTPWGTAGASYIANAFEYDGSSWTNVTAYPDTGVGLISFGTQTASAFGGGAQGGSPGPEANEKSKLYKEYDGTNWTTGGATNVFHSRTQASAGTLTAGIVYGGGDAPGGNPSGRGDKVEEYNGTAWTSALTAPQENALGGGFGTQTAFLSSCGQDSPTPSSPGTTGYSLTTLVYDGTTMRTDANAATRRVYLGADGSIGASTGMVCGGSTSYSTRTTATEEYSQETTAGNVKTLTTS